MPYTSPATVVTGTAITSAWGNSVKAGEDFLANAPSCRVFHNTTQALTNNTEATVAFNSERHDNDTMHDNVTNNSRITIKTAGVYVVSFTGIVEADNDYNFLYAYIRANGATPLAMTGLGSLLDLGWGPALNLSTVYKFAVNDYVEVRISQKNTSAGAHNLSSLANYSPEFAAQWVSLG